MNDESGSDWQVATATVDAPPRWKRRQVLHGAAIGTGIGGVLGLLNGCAVGSSLQGLIQAATGNAQSAQKSQAAMAVLADSVDDISVRYVSAVARSPAEIAEGLRYLTQLLGAAFERFVEGDPTRPYLISASATRRKLLGDNPDGIYYFSQLDGKREHIIRGRRNGREYLGITVHGGAGPIGQWNLAGTAHINHRKIKYKNRRGDYEIHLGPTRGKALNWLQTGPETHYVICRHYYENTVSVGNDPDIDPKPTIEPVQRPPAPGRLSDQILAERLLAVVAFMRASTIDFPAQLMPYASSQPNQLGTPFNFATMGRDNHMGAIDNTYSTGAFLLEPQEVLLMEGRLPTCYFANIVLSNHFLQSGDFRHRTISLNRRQLRLEPDGSYRIAISAHNPQTGNWLDTAGRRSGLLQWRFLLAEGKVQRPRTRVVSYAEARGLPSSGRP